MEQTMVCGCRFRNSQSVYHYKSEDASICVGDRVMVDVDSAYSLKVAEVVTVTYCTAADAPYPLDRMKTIQKRLPPIEKPPQPKRLSEEELAEYERKAEQMETVNQFFGMIILLLFAPFALIGVLLTGIGRMNYKTSHPRKRDR